LLALLAGALFWHLGATWFITDSIRTVHQTRLANANLPDGDILCARVVMQTLDFCSFNFLQVFCGLECLSSDPDLSGNHGHWWAWISIAHQKETGRVLGFFRFFKWIEMTQSTANSAVNSAEMNVYTINYQVVVSFFFHFHPDPWGNDPIWLIFFKRGWWTELERPDVGTHGFCGPWCTREGIDVGDVKLVCRWFRTHVVIYLDTNY